MRPHDGAGFLLLGRFSEFYEEVAFIKQAHAEGLLSKTLAVGDEEPPTHPPDVAARVAGRLLAVMARQTREIRGSASAMEEQAFAQAQYAMAALADEIFLLELPWTAREAWLSYLLENRLFRSRCAGQRFFQLVEQLLCSRERGGVQVDLAAVYLLTLQLGFKGIHRGPSGVERIQRYREQLFRIVEGVEGDGETRACPQAYDHVLAGKKDQRLAPLSPWLAMARFGLIGFAALSTVAWGALIYPFVRTFGM
ncbi:MAG TPA: DotU family type IV/VI secretion system protein [Paucimonas sp.]|nr:DotU family type IV/VI secretion system protein [Paucimonas sp.]